MARAMPRPNPDYTILRVNYQSGDRLKVELIDLGLPGARSYRIRINGQWAQKVPVASKTEVMRQLRSWWVTH